MGSSPLKDDCADVTETMEKKRRPREEIVKELIEREDPENPNRSIVFYEDELAEAVKEFLPDVGAPGITLEDAPGITRKTLLYWRGKYYDIEAYAKEHVRKREEAIARGEIGDTIATAKEGQDAKVTGWIRADAKRIVEDLKAERVPEWADAWILDGRSPLIA